MSRHTAQIQEYGRNVLRDEARVRKPEPLTFQEYVFGAERQPKGQCREDEVLCVVCGCAGKEQVLSDRVRIYHPQRLHPCRAPEGYVPVQKISEQLVPA